MLRKGAMKILSWMLLSCAVVANAQQAADTTGWKHSVVAGLTATQVSYKDWVQGGENMLAWTATLEGKSMDDLPNYVWTNTYNFAYGNTKLGTQGVRKTADKIDIASEFKYKLDAYVNPYVAALFQTQFTRGYTYDALGAATANSNFFDPAYIILSAGASYQPVPEVKTRIGAALREIVTNAYTQYSGGTKSQLEGGLESVTEVDARLYDNLFFKANLALFSPVRKMQEIVVRSDNTLIAKINKYFSTNINVQLIQERPISPRTQVRQSVALGFNYVLF
jgi:hypothetical protein